MFLWKGPQEINEAVDHADSRNKIEEELADVVILLSESR